MTESTATVARREFREKWIMIAIAIALVSLVPSAVLGALLYREIDQRSDVNRKLIEEDRRQDMVIAKERTRVRLAIRRADIANCKSDELVKARLRRITQFKPAEVAQTLIQLGIDPESERGRLLTLRAKRNADEATLALRPRDCSKLPDPRAPTR